ncbi:uncharacterized protein LOC106675650 [Maylandia zebra]|uniref:uncharacterized protein LOC106675650 n=1 Tax=Maylandia zebra TaxID=106582 RepID=UPI00403CBA69
MDAQGTPLASGIDVKGPPIEEIAAEVPVVDGGSLTGAWKTPESTLAGIRWICSVYSSPQSLSTWVSGTKKHSANVWTLTSNIQQDPDSVFYLPAGVFVCQ